LLESSCRTLLANRAGRVGVIRVADAEELLDLFPCRLALALVRELAAVDPAAHAKVSSSRCTETMEGLGFGDWGLGIGVWGLGFGVWGLGFGI